MSAWSRLVRFEDEQGKVQLGEPVDASQDIGLACAAGEKVQVKLIKGDLYDGIVTDEVATIKRVSDANTAVFERVEADFLHVRSDHHLCTCSTQLLAPLTRDDCSIIRCLGLNYKGESLNGLNISSGRPLLTTFRTHSSCS